MKYAILGDIHANLEAFNAVMKDSESEGVEHYMCTGDLVGYNADPKGCLRIIKRLKCRTVQGNHDYYAACNESVELFNPSAGLSLNWTRKQLSPADRKYLHDLPLFIDVENFTLVHSSLIHPQRWGYITTREAANKNFRNLFGAICFFGHTHIPLAFVKEGESTKEIMYETLNIRPGFQYLINVGSVGQPRDRNPKAAYVIYDRKANTVVLRRIGYDVQGTQQKICTAGLPSENAVRLANGY